MRHVLQGPCLHGGFARCEITESDAFELYMKTGNEHLLRMELKPESIGIQDHMVSVCAGSETLQVVEHLFSALYGMDCYGVRAVVHGKELPIFDGSSGPYADALLHDETIRFPRARLEQPLMVNEQESFIRYEPGDEDMLIITMGLSHPYLGTQQYTVTVDRTTYCKEIAPARTFVYTDESDPRLQNLPPYGIGITETRIYSTEPLRFLDEPVRHKILDLLGDMFVIQRRVCGSIHAYNTFHLLNARFVAEFLARAPRRGKAQHT
jgi:UDP-3-O-acyl-N-acetylglucosamine deacetylase